MKFTALKFRHSNRGSSTLLLLAFLLLNSGARPAHCLDNGLALKPPMGWNSWNIFEGEIDEVKIKEIIDAMVERGLRDAGYVYVVLDDNWMEGYEEAQGITARDAHGNLIADQERFPSGIKALADYVHSKGMKLGIYGDRGRMTCQKIKGSGSLGNEMRDAQTWASWEVDYLKYDNCWAKPETKQADYEKMRDSLAQVSRPIVYSICAWGFEPWMPEAGHLWRTTFDIAPFFKSREGIEEKKLTVLEILDQNEPLYPFAKPGAWNDPDMLEVGNLKDRLVEGEYTEDRTHFSLWAIMAAPLFIGTDVRTCPQEIIDILSNKDVIAINQDPLGVQGRKIKDYGETEIYLKPLSDRSKAVLLLNRSEEPQDIILHWEDIGTTGTATVRDVWVNQRIGKYTEKYTAKQIPAHGSQLLKVQQPLPKYSEEVLPEDQKVKLTRDVKAPNGLPAHKIETERAVYYFDKEGGAISHMLDKEGHDWISHSPEEGTGAAGEYRGFPNAVHNQDGIGAFHPMNKGQDPSTIRILHDGINKVAIKAISENGLWECMYEFYPNYLTWTMTKVPEGREYWCLYEGTPGGSYDDTDYWMTSAVMKKVPLTERHQGDIPGPEWICFGDASLDRVLFLAHHQDDTHPDTFYQMENLMTVFGFGRRGLNHFLTTPQQSVTIGFIESTEHSTISSEIDRLLGPPPAPARSTISSSALTSGSVAVSPATAPVQAAEKDWFVVDPVAWKVISPYFSYEYLRAGTDEKEGTRIVNLRERIFGDRVAYSIDGSGIGYAKWDSSIPRFENVRDHGTHVDIQMKIGLRRKTDRLYRHVPVLEIEYQNFYGGWIFDLPASNSGTDYSFVMHGMNDIGYERGVEINAIAKADENIFGKTFIATNGSTVEQCMYKDHFMYGVLDQKTGKGIGFAYPARQITVEKWKPWFHPRYVAVEMFTSFKNNCSGLKRWIYAVYGGKDELLALGKRCVDGEIMGSAERSVPIGAAQ